MLNEIVYDPLSKEVKGIIKFQDFNEAKKSINELNGQVLMNKQIKLTYEIILFIVMGIGENSLLKIQFQ